MPDVTAQHERELQFRASQILDLFSPFYVPWSNPGILKKTRDECGLNLVEGVQNFLLYMQNTVVGTMSYGADIFQPGRRASAHLPFIEDAPGINVFQK